MEFKIDTKSTYTNIKPPVAGLDAIMTEAIRQKWYELMGEGCQNMILDLQDCTEATDEGIVGLLQLHEENYNNSGSFVITGVPPGLLQHIKNIEGAEVLNIVPTIDEAVDLVNMEILERDLFNEE